VTIADTVREARDLADGGDFRAGLDLLAREQRASSHPRLAAEMIQFRHEYFDQVDTSGPADPPPRIRAGEWGGPVLVELRPDELDEESFRREMTRHGCVLVRGLLSEEQATVLRDGIDRALAAYDADPDDMVDRATWFRAFTPRPEHGKLGGRRKFMREAGSLWAVDSPRMFQILLEMLDETGMVDLVERVLRERPVLSANKFNLRRVPPGIPTNWHQDGAFLGQEIRSVNLWLSLSDCGIDAPGLDLVPRRIDEVVETGTRGAIFDWSVAQEVVDEVAGEAGVIRPRFGPGDALIFDHLFLHRTALSDEMTKERYAIESWFFSPSTFPDGQVPVLL
jgi:Phytanoyl-CoA dioxygenase (PhyH)